MAAKKLSSIFVKHSQLQPSCSPAAICSSIHSFECLHHHLQPACVCVPVCVAGLCRLMLPGGIAICNKSKSAAAAATARRLQQLQVDTQTRLRLLPLPLPLPLPAQARIPTMLFPPPPLTRGPGRQQHTLSTQACVRFQVESLSATVSKH